MEPIAHFFNSNFFIALITFLVGSIAIYLYRKQTVDHKKSAANTILQEIVNAEKLIDSAKLEIGESRRAGFTLIPEHHYLMPTESWSKYKSLFVNNLTSEEWDRLNNFYNDCSLFDEIISYSDSQFEKDTTEIRKNSHKGIFKYVSEYADKISKETDEVKIEELKEELKKKKDIISDLATSAEFMHTYVPSKPTKDLEKLIDTIDTKISLDTIGQKLKAI